MANMNFDSANQLESSRIIPPGGAAGSTLTKNSGSDFDVSWTAVPVDDRILSAEINVVNNDAVLTKIRSFKPAGLTSGVVQVYSLNVTGTTGLTQQPAIPLVIGRYHLVCYWNPTAANDVIELFASQAWRSTGTSTSWTNASLGLSPSSSGVLVSTNSAQLPSWTLTLPANAAASTSSQAAGANLKNIYVDSVAPSSMQPGVLYVVTGS
jgi:hypothetical protein